MEFHNDGWVTKCQLSKEHDIKGKKVPKGKYVCLDKTVTPVSGSGCFHL